ncbi:hypothetical protein HDU67_006221 [Dinochytrium kinnereticum]|nr:hypothetical protein HDU67_006221 [Dinochytrium kinnereticum]
MDRHTFVISTIQTTLNELNLTFNDLISQIERVREKKARSDEAAMESLAQLLSTRLKISAAAAPASCGRFKPSLIRSNGLTARLHKTVHPDGMKSKRNSGNPRLRIRLDVNREVKPASRSLKAFLADTRTRDDANKCLNLMVEQLEIFYHEFSVAIERSGGEPFRNDGEMRKCLRLAVERVWGAEEKREVRRDLMECY